MATTTNYGWTTPDDTALVKDGASAIRTLGSSVDTTTKNLNPSTTLGDIEYRSSTSNTNTRVGIGSSGQALTVVAGVPSWAASATSVLTTTGDTLYASAANTLARRAIGSTGDVLTVSGGIPTWATPASGGMTSIASGSLSGTSISLTSIAGTYNNLVLLIKQPKVSASPGGALMVRTNNDSTSTYTIQYWITGTTSSFTNFTTRTAHWANNFNGTTSANNDFVAYTFLDYANATTLKAVQINAVNGSNATFGIAYNTAITAAITRLDILDNNGATFNGGTYVLYGVK